MLRFAKTKVKKEKLYAAKNFIKIWDANVDNIVISKLIERKTNFKYLIGHSDKPIRPLVLIMSKLSGYVKTFKVKDIYDILRIDDEKVLQKYKSIWTKIEDLNQTIYYDDIYIYIYIYINKS